MLKTGQVRQTPCLTFCSCMKGFWVSLEKNCPRILVPDVLYVISPSQNSNIYLRSGWKIGLNQYNLSASAVHTRQAFIIPSFTLFLFWIQNKIFKRNKSKHSAVYCQRKLINNRTVKQSHQKDDYFPTSLHPDVY